jgi:predicted SAM-dependent methyltransferase
MKKLNYLNIGCGNKFHKDWINIDMYSNSKDVIVANLLNGIPFPDDSFDVIYHSQVLEHFPKENAQHFMKECFRVLKTNGIIRIVVPDLENIINEYQSLLKQNIENPNNISLANYDWIMLELFDQTVRNYSGGQMVNFLKQSNLINEKYIIDRVGFVGKEIRNSNPINNLKKSLSSLKLFKKGIIYLSRKIGQKISLQTEASKVGAFRLGGEIHMWMYDRYSLSRLLKTSGFVDISIKNPYESAIVNWNEYELDIKDGLVYDPTSLFIEARKI